MTGYKFLGPKLVASSNHCVEEINRLSGLGCVEFPKSATCIQSIIIVDSLCMLHNYIWFDLIDNNQFLTFTTCPED